MTKAELEAKIQEARDAYYNGEAIISDAEYDALEDELLRIDPTNAILQGIGEDNVDGFPKAKHNILMGSQSKCNTVDQVAKKLRDIVKGNNELFVVSDKADGISLELNYKNGKLISGITRGNGYIGDDITPNVKKMRGVQHTIPDSDIPITIRGEILCFHDVKDKYFPNMKNCRNAAAGITKRLDGVDSDKLSVVVYDAQCEDDRFNTETAKLAFLRKAGFIVVNTTPVLVKPNEIDKGAQELYDLMIRYHANASRMYDIDGVVVKKNVVDIGDIKSNLRPKTQWAIKKKQEIVATTLRDIEWGMTNGTLVPVGVYDTVEMEGAECNRATLNNPRYLENLKLEIGDTIGVIRANSVIPRVVSNISKNITLSYYEP